MADINVLMVVDTKNVTQQNLPSTVTLVDDNFDVDDTANNSTTFDIIIPVGQAMSIQFRIAAVDQTTTVSLTSFTQQGTIFTKLPASDNSFIGTALSNTVGTTDKFTINFMVGTTQYSLDPEINVKPR